MSIELWLSFAAIELMFSLSPGAAVILTMSQSMARGMRAGAGVIAGVQLGNLIYFVISAAGLGAILATSETAFMVIKYAGALYLVWLGVKTIRNASKAADENVDAKMPIWQGSFSQGLVNQLANPKAILFYTAMFPQFVDYESANLILQLAILAVTTMIIEVPVLLLYAAIAVRGGRLLSGGKGAVWRERICGSALIAVGGAMTMVKRTA